MIKFSIFAESLSDGVHDNGSIKRPVMYNNAIQVALGSADWDTEKKAKYRAFAEARDITKEEVKILEDIKESVMKYMADGGNGSPKFSPESQEFIDNISKEFANFQTQNESVSFVNDSDLIEEAIQFDNRSAYGNVLFLSGGAGSGKGFVLKNFIDASNYKVLDVDEMKQKVLKIAKNKDYKGRYHELKGIGNFISDEEGFELKNPEHTAKVHEFVKKYGIYDQTLEGIAKNKTYLPNLVFDITGADPEDFERRLIILRDMGYNPKNINLIWVLANIDEAWENNLARPRVVPENIFLSVHTGASKTMQRFINGSIPRDIDGEFYIILSGKSNNLIKKIGSVGIAHPKKIKIKEKGKPVMDDQIHSNAVFGADGVKLALHGKLAELVWSWINENVPKETLEK